MYLNENYACYNKDSSQLFSKHFGPVYNKCIPSYTANDNSSSNN